VHVPLVSTRTALRAAVTALAAVVADAQAADRAGGPSYHRPKVGTCHDLDYSEAAADADPKAPVSCSSPHTLVTTRVVHLPRGFDDSRGRRLYAAAERACVPPEHRLLGDERQLAMSSYGYVFFLPTPAAWAHGARWLRCDVGHFGATSFVDLPTRLHRLGRPPLRDSVARCLQPDLSWTPCTAPHAYRAVDTVRHPDGPFPTKRQWATFGARRAPAVVGSKDYGYTYPSVYAWRG
jgi:hypothetical protein